MTLFKKYQMWMWTCLSYLSVCRFYITENSKGQYEIHKTGRFRRYFYYAMWINAFIKIGYLILTYHALLGIQVGFLDQMCMWDWFLGFGLLVQAVYIWFGEYPLYEVIHANWKVQEEIFKKLGSPIKIDKRVTGTCRGLVHLHTFCVFVGCGALAIQFFIMPKFPLNTYAVVPFDNWVLRITFAAHECIYMFYVWVHQACTIVLLETFSVTYTALINEMTRVMKGLGKIEKIHKIEGNNNNEELLDTSSTKGKNSLKVWNKNVDPYEKLKGTEYNFITLLKDYKQIMIASRQFNAWAGKLMGGSMLCNCGQFVSDVFMMIQLLKEPDIDLLGVAFFAEDACAGMTLLIRCLILVSRLYPSSSGFLQEYNSYLKHENPHRKYLLKCRKALPIVATKVGGYSTNPSTVPQGINALMNYYIGAAMWQRPDASSGRRT